MFGAFRCSKNASNKLEYVDLSGNSGVDARNYTVLACDQCRERKLKCSGDPHGCARCQAAHVTCTYRTSNTTRYTNPMSKCAISSSGPSDSSSSRRRQSSSRSKYPSKPSTKKQRARSGIDYKSTRQETSASGTMEIDQALAIDVRDDFWAPILLDPVFSGQIHDWNMDSLKDHQGLHPTPHPSPLAPEIQSTPQFSALGMGSKKDEYLISGLVLTPPATANDAASSVVSSEDRRCNCIGYLADTLERISDNGDSNAGQHNSLDGLLGSMRDGIVACKQFSSCNYCSVCTTHPILVVTVIQKLAAMSQDLCRKLMTQQQHMKAMPTNGASFLSPTLDIHVGNFQVSSAALGTEITSIIVCMQFKDLHILVSGIENDMKRGTKAFKLLGDAAATVKMASNDLQKMIHPTTRR